MELTEKEKKLIKLLLERQIKELEKDEITAQRDEQIAAIAIEETYEDFLRKLLKKFE